MGLRINTNVQSLSAQRNLNNTNQATKASLEKIASGTRIARSADDAAGLAISEKMRAQIRSIRQDTRNANDGISMIQTAEGGMNEIGNILVRFRELSIQGASDTIGDSERGFIDKEVQQLKSEINRISESTEFNGRKLLSADSSELEIQIGQGNKPEADRFKFDLAETNVSADKLGVSGLSVADKASSQANLDTIDSAIQSLSSSRANLGAMQNRLQSSVNNLAVYDENLSAARSRIADIDMASETAEMAKNNILTQAGVSVLSQANQNPMVALKLMG